MPFDETEPEDCEEVQMHEGQTNYLVPAKQPENGDEQRSQVESYTRLV